MSKAQSTAPANRTPAPFIVQRNLGAVRNDRVARPTFPGELGKRYEVLERISAQWSPVTVLTVINGGRRQ